MDQLQKDHFLKIVEKYHSGNASREELEFLHAYYEGFSLNDNYTDTLSEADRLLLKNELKNSIKKKLAVSQQGRVKSDQRNVIRWTISAAAAVIICIGVGLYYFPEEIISNPIAKSAAENEIIPGGNKAILTLADGEKISLTDVDNGTVIEHAGTKIVKTADGQLVFSVLPNKQVPLDESHYNTIETPKGGRYQIRLPDGSNVWLNAASKLTFPSSFISLKNRTVELNGEAYFDIATDKKHPFIVKTYNQVVEVFGTEFNINSYVDEPAVKTTLLEGSIKVSGKKGNDKILVPGQQSTLTPTGLRIDNIDTDQSVAWKENQFVFESDDIQYIMRMISRWYNVEVAYVGEIPKSRFGGAVSRFEHVSEVLKSLESTGRVKFEIDGRRILVSK
jgi:ferric-dicitrate binding protein FerR (iron transport regulator)